VSAKSPERAAASSEDGSSSSGSGDKDVVDLCGGDLELEHVRSTTGDSNRDQTSAKAPAKHVAPSCATANPLRPAPSASAGWRIKVMWVLQPGTPPPSASMKVHPSTTAQQLLEILGLSATHALLTMPSREDRVEKVEWDVCNECCTVKLTPIKSFTVSS
jgi:hypothetical protein